MRAYVDAAQLTQSRKPHLLRPLAAQLLPPPLAACDTAERLWIDLASLRMAEDCRQMLATALAALTRGEITPAEWARIAKQVRARLRAVARLARFSYSKLRGAAQIAFRPDGRECLDQIVDVGLAVHG
jgi:hypothetical protein